MNIEEQKKLLAMKRTTRGQLREGDRAWGGRLWEICQPTNRNLIGGRWDGTRWHNTSKFLHSVPKVNEAVGQRRYQCLPMEISSTCGVCESARSVGRGNMVDDRREVSRGHSSWAKTIRGAAIGSLQTMRPVETQANEGLNQ